MEVKLYDKDLSGTYIEDLTSKVQGLRFSTKLHGGFHICTFTIQADLPEAWEWITKRPFSQLKITEATTPSSSQTLWDGRVEDIEITLGSVSITAFGYYANLSDIPYNTAYDDNADVVIKDILTANCAQISSTQTNIDATGGPAIDSAANASYVDIYPNEIVERLSDFSDTTNDARWYFAIWEDRIPYFFARSTSTVDWTVRLEDLTSFRLKHRGGNLWNSCYAVYDAAGLARTATSTDTDSVTKYGLTRLKVIPDLGTVVVATANSYREGFLANNKDIWPSLENITIGKHIFDTNGVRFSSSLMRAGEVLRILDLVPASGDLTTVARDALRTFYILETHYDVATQQQRVVVDTESTSLDAILARSL